jgi:hypothetical protein
MTRLAMSALFGHLGYTALAAQSQIPLRTGDCVHATQELDFFYKDEGEYERTHRIKQLQAGVLLNLGSGADDQATVEFIDPKTREPVVEGTVFMHQVARTPWEQGVVANPNAKTCMTAKDGNDGYQPVVKMTKCADADQSLDDKKKQWSQQFTWSRAECGPRPIRWTADPSKCVDAVHPNKVLLTDCSGVDSQKFQFRCKAGGLCYITAMGGRKDMCLWWDKNSDDADLQIRTCNYEAQSSAGLNAGVLEEKPTDGASNQFLPMELNLHKKETRPNTAPVDR